MSESTAVAPATKRLPTWMEAYCFECAAIQPIVQILGRRKAPLSKQQAVYAAVRLSCGHERHGDDRVVMRTETINKVESVLMEAKLLRWQERNGVASALAMSD